MCHTSLLNCLYSFLFPVSLPSFFGAQELATPKPHAWGSLVTVLRGSCGTKVLTKRVLQPFKPSLQSQIFGEGGTFAELLGATRNYPQQCWGDRQCRAGSPASCVCARVCQVFTAALKALFEDLPNYKEFNLYVFHCCGDEFWEADSTTRGLSQSHQPSCV